MFFGYTINPFPENADYHLFSAKIYDEALIFSIIGFLGFLISFIVRKKFIFFYPENNEILYNRLSEFYYKFRDKLIIIFFLFFTVLNILNLYFEIYQKGITSTFEPNIIVLLYKWLLLMGLSSFACMFVNYDLLKNKNHKISSFAFLIESCSSNISILSRSFIFNIFILGMIYFEQIKKGLKLKFSFIIFSSFICLILFFTNISLSTKLRTCVDNYSDNTKIEKVFFSKKCLTKNETINQSNPASKSEIKTYEKIFSLMISRWVGIDSMMAIMNKKDILSFKTYLIFLNEKYYENEQSLYEKYFLTRVNNSNRPLIINKVILPGFLSYQSISGSLIFVFFSCFLIGLIGGLLEKFCYKIAFKNRVLCAFISYIFVFRLIHFGYIPINSLTYFIVIIFTFTQYRIYNLFLNFIHKLK
tara:strand:- start:668 stop:1915 length:1248 start_codon:yes stop_codon:yes gene_type:complete